MRIIALRTLRVYWAKEPLAEQPLKSWYAAVEKAQWENHNELKEQFGKASIINNKRVVFDIHGNKYRLIVDIEYLIKEVYVVWVGTHAEYDKIKVENVKYKRFN
jgi:mRNA interferase HigB